MPLEGDDISEIIQLYRDGLPFSDQLPSFDPPKHTAHRALLMRLIMPKRLKENEAFMWRLADRQIDEFLPRIYRSATARSSRPPRADDLDTLTATSPVEECAMPILLSTTRTASAPEQPR